MTEAIGGMLLKAGVLTQVDAPLSNFSAGFSKSGAELALPPVSGGAPASDAVPTLPPPRAFDAMELAAKFLALKMKMADGQAAAGMEDIRHRGELQKQQNEKIARNIIDAAEKLREAKKSSSAARIFGWIAVALSVVAAVVTGGIFAFSAAAVAVAVGTLTETGVIERMTQAIAKSLIEDQGMAEDCAVIWASIITALIILAPSAACMVGAGAVSGGWNAVTSIATKITSQGDKLAKIANVSQRLATAALAGEGTASAAEFCAGLVSGIFKYQATNARVETLDIRKFLGRLAQLQEDEMARIQELVVGIKTMTQRVVDAIEAQCRSASTVIRHIG
ncbi:type III secretion system translocon subunit SctE (plasmid) [Mesorhizobium sp. AR07]|uniref:type III secretion system translocon subunit SctE n=1 Tax=Mesorhizobium sp. AR07 TaxID=2865838 RepID=UPI00215F46B7|nr:type III secretion system translocon subunit SctE [Mesorhizobium sp. AR07]UVK49076.1 type III secretion system translocon subunit SctE [Mesorhizobium sp. AR07]